MAEICWRVWGTPANFNGFRVLAALLNCTLVVGVSQTAVLNRGRHLYLAGRPSCWALAHILVSVLCSAFFHSHLEAVLASYKQCKDSSASALTLLVGREPLGISDTFFREPDALPVTQRHQSTEGIVQQMATIV